MSQIKASCPACGLALNVPAEAVGKAGRCPACAKVFRIDAAATQPEKASVTEDDVLNWLDGDGQWQGEEPSVAGAPVGRAGKPATSAPAAAPPAAAPGVPPPARPGPSQALPAEEPSLTARPRKRFTVTLGHLDDMGTFFLFEPILLYDADFRGAFVQRCIVCGGKTHLAVHLIIWAAKLPERDRFGAKTSYSRSVIELDRLGGRQGRDLLAVLQPIQNLPEPFNLPMPYYVCRACSPVGAVVTDVRTSPDGRGEVCELGLSSLGRALEFARAVCGEDCPATRSIGEAIRQSKGDAWRSIPLAVRSRINQWYKPLEAEKFIAYYPDGDFAKTEAGMAGVVLTNRRLVYRKFAALVDVPLTERMALETKVVGDKARLHITVPGGKVAVLSADPAAIEQLRQQLRRTGAHAHWAR